ncbi:MAG: nucleotidyltransferase family protein [Deltaproteobacteria bacterium]|nr:nucleotidyltransferase family protein [Deltaproteobacteria bacterium]
MEALILAGGLGTRLGVLVKDLPKPLLPVGDRPFLDSLIRQLKGFGITNITCLIGYQKEKIKEYFKEGKKLGVHLRYVEEEELLGTGGAVKAALPLLAAGSFLLLNGDSFFGTNIPQLIRFHQNHGKGATIALKELVSPDRYGTVDLSSNNEVLSFREKDLSKKKGYINAGIYLLEKRIFDQVSLNKFSLERDLFPKLTEQKELHGLPMTGEFIDIGIPEDYQRAQELVPHWIALQKGVG